MTNFPSADSIAMLTLPHEDPLEHATLQRVDDGLSQQHPHRAGLCGYLAEQIHEQTLIERASTRAAQGSQNRTPREKDDFTPRLHFAYHYDYWMELKVGVHPQAVTAPPRVESRARVFFCLGVPVALLPGAASAGAFRGVHDAVTADADTTQGRRNDASAGPVIRSKGNGTGDMDSVSEPRPVMGVPSLPNLPPEISIAASTAAAVGRVSRGGLSRATWPTSTATPLPVRSSPSI